MLLADFGQMQVDEGGLEAGVTEVGGDLTNGNPSF